MSRLLLRLLDVVRLRAGPQDMPGGWSIAVLLCLAYLIQGLLADQMLDDGAATPRSLVALAVQVAATALLLRARGFSSRLPQVITTLAGTGFLFGLISTLLVMQINPGEVQAGLVVIWLILFLWSLTVDGHIYRHALSITMSMGVLVAVLVFGLNFMVIESLFNT